MRKRTSLSISALLMASSTLCAVASAQDVDTSQIADQIIVRGVNIPDEKRATSEISTVLSTEDLARAGDADIASALRRVTGLSLAQGKFIIVRGLNERYSSLTLNGSPLPSPEPLRRVAPLDLLPTSIVETALVQKTFSPQFSGEFGGGLIELRSKGIPDERFFDISLSAALDTETTGRDGLTYDGGSTDFIGFPGGIRDFPPGLGAAITANPGRAITASNGFDADTLTSFASEIPASELFVVQNVAVPVNYGVKLSGGDRYDLDGGQSLGFVGAFGYNRNFQTKRGQQGAAAFDAATGQAIQGIQDFEFESLTETVLLNGLLSTGVEFNDDHSLNITGLILRKTTKEARQRVGEETASNNDELIFLTNTEFFENQVWTVQGESEHYFDNVSGLTVSLRGSYSEAFRDAPFETAYGFILDEGNPQDFLGEDNVELRRGLLGGESLLDFRSNLTEFGSTPRADTFQTRFSRVDDQTFSGGGDLELPFNLGSTDWTLRAGGAYYNNERDYFLRTFGVEDDTGLDQDDDFFNRRIDFIVLDPRTPLIELPDTFQPRAYVGELEVFAGYFGADVQLTNFIRAAAGFRYESSEQLVDNFSVAATGTGTPFTGVETVIDEDYFLPAVTITWNPVDNIQVRAGFSQTITRPQFQELGAAIFTDTDRDLQVFGNPFLVNTETDNYDIRFEYYFGREQYITLGGFYKEITNPIEESLINTGASVDVSYINAPSAELYGFEFEYEQRFDVSNSKQFLVNTNYTWSQSEVDADGVVTIPGGTGVTPFTSDASNFFVDGRALQGQSNHIVNAQISLEDFDRGERITLQGNWVSERIRQVGLITGAGQVPNTLERLPVTIDFVYSRDLELLGGNTNVQARISNILNDRYEATADSIEIDVYDLGTTFSLSFKKEF
ncbi:MAG: TonB-dependent receptor [Pseudomonadota bacterium]